MLYVATMLRPVPACVSCGPRRQHHRPASNAAHLAARAACHPRIRPARTLLPVRTLVLCDVRPVGRVPACRPSRPLHSLAPHAQLGHVARHAILAACWASALRRTRCVLSRARSSRSARAILASDAHPHPQLRRALPAMRAQGASTTVGADERACGWVTKRSPSSQLPASSEVCP